MNKNGVTAEEKGQIKRGTQQQIQIQRQTQIQVQRQPVQVPQDLAPMARKRRQRESRSPARKAQSFLKRFFRVEKHSLVVE